MAKTKKVSKGRSSPTQGLMTGSSAVRAKKRMQKPRIKRVSWRDEQVEGMSVSDAPTEEFTDPAILVIRETVKISYSKEELLKIREAPLSKKKPDFFDTSEVTTSIWDPERWGFERKKSDTPIENGPRSSGDGPSEHRRRPGDPRERIRKESDGIVLSPQRRSFNSGCFVPVRGDTTRNNRSHSPLGPKNDGSHVGGIREIQSSTRRIGSGRILRDFCDFNDKLDSGDNEYSYRSQQRNNNNDREDKFGDKYERRSFGRDFEMTRDRENNNKETRRMNKGFDRRRISENREQEEPEWFSGGPLSQNDTIELRGFDDDKPIRKKLSPSNLKRMKEPKKKVEPALPQLKNDDKNEPEVILSEPKGGSGPQVGNQKETNEKHSESLRNEEKDNKVDIDKTDEESRVNALVNDHSFNFDDILKCDTIPGLLTNGVGGDGDNSKSRFSRWFKQESPEKPESRRSSLHDDHLINNLLKDLEPNVTIPGDSEAYFAPISPAANTGGIVGSKREFQQQSQAMNIMDMLQRGKQQPDPMKQPVTAGKILNLEELEAKIRQDSSTGIPTKHQPQKPDEDMAAAFKKLLEQAQAGGHPTSMNTSMNKTQPMSLLEMLDRSQQQDEAARMSGSNPHLLAPSNSSRGGIQHHQHMTNDLSMKLHQAQIQQNQMDMLNKLINQTTSVHPQQLRASPLHDLVIQQSRDLLNRPEAQAILQGLKRGEITTQHLYQQLANPALQPRHREMLINVLKYHGGGGFGPSPRVLSPVPPHHMFQQQQQQQQQQQLRVSPLPPNAMHQRIPSPRELQVHTQNILQRALIKKKLEEQQENYRKKQELQRGQSPSNGLNQAPTKNVTSPTPLAFTPTSVLRKMTAEKDEGKENKVNIEGKIPPGRPLTGMRPQPPQPQVQQWNTSAQYTKHQGRPIVKANNNFQLPLSEQFFGQQNPQQQQVLQQRAHQQLAFQQQHQQQQQRKALNPQAMGGPQFTSNQGVPQSQYNTQQYSSNQQFTQQQLRAQHQHRPANQQQQQNVQPMSFQQQQQQPNNHQHMGGGNWQFFNQHPANRSSKAGLESDGGRPTSSATTSTTSTVNQLARWFSPDLLELARAGELPSTSSLSQNLLSLEEIERQTAPPVHN
ncbi:eukaryotic translation initiation factor 4E transporter-like isoform X3 [Diabrotica virgifera virgifera]|uniref:Eukaryotic translation initiation factor 4E transporter-like n=1 Tax=Diabrotica virgifera virgifera TaxID=50390 RepID=A0ABM5JMP9_DIAVI|nr:eukaryotic translation initiation factor 4E transporter-like isoform X3 [Diabrotica virgifera virgifera]